jgi:hypothetical protein
MKVNEFTISIKDASEDSVVVILTSDPIITEENADDVDDTPSVRFVEAIMDFMEDYFEDDQVFVEEKVSVH